MNPRADFEEFVDTGSELAFGALVNCYCNLVFGTALRRTGNRELAEEVSQDVFALLASKASTIRHPKKLGAWLHRTAVLTSSNAMKKETTRRRAMKRLLASTDLNSEGNDSVWQETIPHLDDAMNRLRNSDRQSLILRFYEGHTYKEMAENFGKSEEAVRKQTSRALNKVSRLLQRRGVAIPSVILGSGLGAILTNIEVGATVKTITTGALASKGQSAVSLSACLAMLFGSRIGLIAFSAVAVLIGVTVDGYRVGAESGDELDNPSGSNRSETKGAVVANQTAKPLQSEEHPEAVRDLRALLERAEKEVKMMAIDGNTARYRAELLLRSIPHDEIAVALGLLKSDGHENHYAITQLLIERWATFSGEAAVAYAVKHLTGSWLSNTLSASVRQWAKRQPVESWRWLTNASEDEVANTDRIAGLIFREWAGIDPASAVEQLQLIEDMATRKAAITGVLESKADESLLEFTDALLELIPDSEDQGDAVSRLVSSWSRRDPRAASAWISTLESNSAQRRKAEEALLHRWIQADAPAAADWVMANGHDAYRWKLRKVVSAWQWRDPYAAGEWLAKQELTEEADEAVMHFAKHLASVDPESGVAWAQTVHLEDKRLLALGQLFSTWRKLAPDAAEDYFEENQWSEQELEAISPK